jgi:hypothetical protein
MLYLATDLHRKQMTTNLRGEDGEPMLRRQVSTWDDEPQKFLADVQRRAGAEGWAAILEVCGFHDWLVELLPKFGCRDAGVVPPDQTAARRKDRRRRRHAPPDRDLLAHAHEAATVPDRRGDGRP